MLIAATSLSATRIARPVTSGRFSMFLRGYGDFHLKTFDGRTGIGTGHDVFCHERRL
jgi:hypothetical protein